MIVIPTQTESGILWKDIIFKTDITDIKMKAFCKKIGKEIDKQEKEKERNKQNVGIIPGKAG